MIYGYDDVMMNDDVMLTVFLILVAVGCSDPIFNNIYSTVELLHHIYLLHCHTVPVVLQVS